MDQDKEPTPEPTPEEKKQKRQVRQYLRKNTLETYAAGDWSMRVVKPPQPNLKGAGRKPKYHLSEEIEHEIIRAIRSGLTVTAAFDLVAIPRYMIAVWKKKADTDPIYDRLFRLMISAAKAFEVDNLELIRKVATGESNSRSWQASAWLLERVHQDKYALVNKMKADVQVDSEQVIKQAIVVAQQKAAKITQDNAELPQLEAPEQVDGE